MTLLSYGGFGGFRVSSKKHLVQNPPVYYLHKNKLSLSRATSSLTSTSSTLSIPSMPQTSFPSKEKDSCLFITACDQINSSVVMVFSKARFLPMTLAQSLLEYGCPSYIDFCGWSSN